MKFSAGLSDAIEFLKLNYSFTENGKRNTGNRSSVTITWWCRIYIEALYRILSRPMVNSRWDRALLMLTDFLLKK